MRKLIVVSVMTVVCLALVTQSAVTQDNPSQTVSALRRAGPPKGPIPRLPSGQPDLSDAAWLASGGNFREHDALMLP